MTAHHSILGIRPDATRAEIRSAWRALVRRSHPDLAGNAPSADVRMKAINAAYDAMLGALARAGGGPSGQGQAQGASGTRGRRARTGPCPRPASAAGKSGGSVGNAGSGPLQSGGHPDRPGAEHRRLVPSAAGVMRMKAALVGSLRRRLDSENARLGGASYSVPGREGWRDDATVLSRGGLPQTHYVTRIDVVGGMVRLMLDSRPHAGPILFAAPRMMRTGERAIRREESAIVMEADVPDGAMGLRLPEADVARCISGGEGLFLEIRFP